MGSVSLSWTKKARDVDCSVCGKWHIRGKVGAAGRGLFVRLDHVEISARVAQ
jgi:hypothetical protein